MQQPPLWLRRIVLPAALVSILFRPQTVLAQASVPGANLPAALPGGLENIIFALLITLIGGFLGGVVYELLSLQGNIELPHRYLSDETTPDTEFRIADYAVAANLYDLGMLARIFIGGMSALAALLLVTPPDIFKLIATSLVAGSAGASIFDMLRARLTATVAQADATLTRANLAQLEGKVDQITRTYGDLCQELQTPPAQPGAPQPRSVQSNGDGVVESAPSPALTADILRAMQEMERLLGEAKGMAVAAQQRP